MSNAMSDRFNERSPSSGPRRARWLAAACGLLIAAGAGAQLPHKYVEECLESGTALVSLPGAPGGSLSASQCRGCGSLRLNFGQRTKYFVGAEAVSYARLREVAGKSPASLNVCYDPATRVLTRLRLAATGNNQ